MIRLPRVTAILLATACACLIVLALGDWGSADPGTTDGNCGLCDCIEVYGYRYVSNNNDDRGHWSEDANGVFEAYEASAQTDLKIGSNGIAGYCAQKPTIAAGGQIKKGIVNNGTQICTGNLADGKVEIRWDGIARTDCNIQREKCTNSILFPAESGR